MQIDEHQLIARVLEFDDQHAFKTLVRSHQSQIRLFVRKIVKKDELADEVAQEVFWLAYRNLYQFEGKSFKSWVYTIAFSESIRTLKKNKQWQNVDEVSSEIAAEVKHKPDLLHDLQEALSELEPKDHKILLMWVKQEMSHQEISDATSMPLGTVKSILLRTRQKLQMKLKDDQKRGK